MCAPGVCAEGSVLVAVIYTGYSVRTIELEATTIEAATTEANKKMNTQGKLLRIESRRVGDETTH